MGELLKTLNQTITFLLEIAMLFALGYYGMTKSWNLFSKLLLAVLLIGIAVFLWGMYAAPRSSNRLEMPALAFFRASLFLTASFLLYQSGQKNSALIFAGLTIVTQTISCFTEK